MAFLIPILIACALRFPDLAQRPMHCDEAVHADKFGILLEQGRYEYSTVDYHGPTLYYLTLVPAWIQRAARYIDISEITLRSVPATLGVVLVALHFLLVRHFGCPVSIGAAMLAAISPAMVYYSRYYIHEILFVCITFAALLSALSYWNSRRSAWAAATGICAGLMCATKETAIIVFACALMALGLARALARLHGEHPAPMRIARPHLALAGISAAVTSMLLFSSLLSHPRGILDAVAAYGTYFERGSGYGTLHVHPWHYYLNLLVFFHTRGGPYWTEGLIAGLALIGLLAAVLRKGSEQSVLRFLACYTLCMGIVYSVIPYKAPWNVLGALHGLILLAGVGMGWLCEMSRGVRARAVTVVVLAAAGIHLGWQAWAGSFRYAADPGNPWVYAHTGNDVLAIIRQLDSLARAYPDGPAMPIQIISRENLWPLPWYLRRYSGARWWNGVSDSAPSAPVIIISPDMEPALVRKLYELPPPGQKQMYVNIFDRYVELRPQVELRAYAAKSLWDECQRLEPDANPKREPGADRR